jgi:asparagine synthase (glutamine-hydrolysing)
MCGIAGIVSLDGFHPDCLVKMTHLAAHRGPDGFGFAYYSQNAEAAPEIIHNQDRLPQDPQPMVGLGNRRLAILDLSQSGNMPMQTEQGLYCVTYNGEIYNYREVRAELQDLGNRFRSETDTEVLLRAYVQWGEDCLHHFNGMWSFALWDNRRRTLFCARDRFGVKPFYYAVQGRSFHFGSEIKQLIHGAALPSVANSRAVFHFLEQGTSDYSSDTFFENIQQLPGGHCLTLRVEDTLQTTIRQYWELKIGRDGQITQQQAREEFQERFANAVRLRLRSDVPVGSSLSGGMDSSAIICQAKRLAPDQNFHTFSACFEEKAIDEREYILSVVDSIQGKSHLSFPQGKSFWDSLDKLLYYHDEPFGSGSIYAQWCVMAEARKQGIPVLLGGQGGDEVLCGYQKYRYFFLWHLLHRKNLQFFPEAFLSTINGTRRAWDLADASRYFPRRFRRSFSVVERLSPPEFRESVQGTGLDLGFHNSLPDRQKADLTFASLPALLHSEDRNSMAHSIESRLPFLDYQLVEFTVNCPGTVKFHNGWSKWLLRNAMQGIMPEKVRTRKSKLGFDAPLTTWMNEGLRNGMRNVWDSRGLRMERFVTSASLARETNMYLNSANGALASASLFRALVLETWARVHGVS